jgi:hypothetical protein
MSEERSQNALIKAASAIAMMSHQVNAASERAAAARRSNPKVEVSLKKYKPGLI